MRLNYLIILTHKTVRNLVVASSNAKFGDVLKDNELHIVLNFAVLLLEELFVGHSHAFTIMLYERLYIGFKRFLLATNENISSFHVFLQALSF